MTDSDKTLAIRLHSLYLHMLAMAQALRGRSEQHAEELSGAAEIVHQWVEKLEGGE